jgi:hypothetical protein
MIEFDTRPDRFISVSIASRLAYRSRQFWNALHSPGVQVEIDALLPYLSTTQIILFRRMHASEQAHAYIVLRRLLAMMYTNSDLLTAALLHDVGKIQSPLSLFDRVVIVLGRHFFPDAVWRWGEGVPRGLRRPFVVAAQHPFWGADLAAAAGASTRTCDLIRHHQDPASKDPFLLALQGVDDES